MKKEIILKAIRSAGYRGIETSEIFLLFPRDNKANIRRLIRHLVSEGLIRGEMRGEKKIWFAL